MYSKVRLGGDPGMGKRKIANNNEVHYIYVGTRCKKLLKIVKQHRIQER
jgi:hypothetical protein